MLNKVTLIGNLTRDVEMRYMPSGDGIANFGLATSHKWKDKEGKRQEETEFHNITIFRGLAKVCGEYLKKGSKVYIEGRIKTEKWEKDGQQHSRVVIIGENMHMLDGKKQDQSIDSSQQYKPQASNNAASEPSDYDDFDDDPIPF
jgi:single-strand DNA-binding protein